MLLPVFVATFAGLALALFVLWAAAAERLSPRERFIRERTQQSGMLAWRRGARLLRTARRAGGRPWRLAPGLEAWLTILQFTPAASALAAATSTIPIVAAPIGEAGLSELMGDMVRPTATSRA